MGVTAQVDDFSITPKLGEQVAHLGFALFVVHPVWQLVPQQLINVLARHGAVFCHRLADQVQVILFVERKVLAVVRLRFRPDDLSRHLESSANARCFIKFSELLQLFF